MSIRPRSGSSSSDLYDQRPLQRPRAGTPPPPSVYAGGPRSLQALASDRVRTGLRDQFLQGTDENAFSDLMVNMSTRHATAFVGADGPPPQDTPLPLHLLRGFGNASALLHAANLPVYLQQCYRGSPGGGLPLLRAAGARLVHAAFETPPEPAHLLLARLDRALQAIVIEPHVLPGLLAEMANTHDAYGIPPLHKAGTPEDVHALVVGWGADVNGVISAWPAGGRGVHTALAHAIDLSVALALIGVNARETSGDMRACIQQYLPAFVRSGLLPAECRNDVNAAATRLALTPYNNNNEDTAAADRQQLMGGSASWEDMLPPLLDDNDADNAPPPSASLWGGQSDDEEDEHTSFAELRMELGELVRMSSDSWEPARRPFCDWLRVMFPQPPSHANLRHLLRHQWPATPQMAAQPPLWRQFSALSSWA